MKINYIIRIDQLIMKVMDIGLLHLVLRILLFVLRVLYSGRVGYENSTAYGDYDYSRLSVRPVVSLNTGVTVNATDEE